MKKLRHLRRLRYLIEYIIFLGFKSIFQRLSLERAGNIAAALLKFIGPFLPVSNIARKNLRRVYGAEIDIESTLLDICDNFGRVIGEFIPLSIMNKEQLAKHVNIIGREHIASLQQQGRPFICFGAHQANWEVMLKVVTQLSPKIALIYRKANNPYMDKEILSKRCFDRDIMMIPKGLSGARELVRAIRDKRPIGLLVDQKMNNGIEVPFFGMPAMTSQVVASLALQYDYPIIPVQIVRKGRGGQFTVTIYPPLEFEELEHNDASILAIMTKINLLIESWVRQYPAQWFWFHNRWKK
jgi:KDO2-lipid IV(A) lauroyltransferase